MKTLKERIRQLCDIPGVSGDEGRVRSAVLSMLEGKAEWARTDPLGNLLVYKKGRAVPENRIMLSAHMDEVGFIITHIEDSGLLRFTAVGGIDSRVVPGKAVEIGDGRLYGVIGLKAIHHAEGEEAAMPVAIDKLAIDIGAKNRADAEKHVKPGDRAVFHANYTEFGNDRILARALDDRAGCALLLSLIDRDLPWDCYFAFTVQEETGCTGAKTAAHTLEPDISIVVETTTASDIPGVAPDRVVCRLGNGPVVSFMDRSSIYDSGLYALALETAKNRNIKCQPKAGVFGGNESRSTQTARGGARVLAVSLPSRYLHSPSCMIDASDLVHTADLLEALIEEAGNL